MMNEVIAEQVERTGALVHRPMKPSAMRRQGAQKQRFPHGVKDTRHAGHRLPPVAACTGPCQAGRRAQEAAP